MTEDRRAVQEEVAALGKLMEAQRQKIAMLKESLKKEFGAVSEEVAKLRELSDEMSKLREMRRIAAVKEASLSRNSAQSPRVRSSMPHG